MVVRYNNLIILMNKFMKIYIYYQLYCVNENLYILC